MKLKLKLNQSELQALNTHLFLTITNQPMEHLREQPADFLVCSVLKEILDRTNAKVEDIRRFPTKRTNAVYPVTLTRSQALAVACSIDVNAESCTLPVISVQEVGSFEAGFLGSLYAQIHRTYLI